MTYTLRDVTDEPLGRDELYGLVYAPNGRQRGPLTCLDRGLVIGQDPVRLAENLADNPRVRTEGATVYGHADDPSTAGVLDWLAAQGVPARLEDVGVRPLDADAVWGLLKLGESDVRVPYTLIDDLVVLGNDRGRLTSALAERGYLAPHPSSE